MFRVSLRAARSWTTGATRVPAWLMPALQIYSLLPAAAQHKARESLVPDGFRTGDGRPTASNRRPNVARHPFARIEEL